MQSILEYFVMMQISKLFPNANKLNAITTGKFVFLLVQTSDIYFQYQKHFPKFLPTMIAYIKPGFLWQDNVITNYKNSTL